MTLGNSTGALVVSALVLLGHAGDRTLPSSRPTDDVLGKETVRVPVATKEAEPPPSAEPAPPLESPKALVLAPSAKSPDPRKSDTPPGGVTAGGLAQKESAPMPAVTLDLGSLEKRLRETTAIGVFTKLSLKNQVDDLLDEFRAFHKTHDRSMLTRLRQAYDLLLLKVLSLLQDGDPVLARDIASSREALWSILTDPDKFKEL